MRLKQEENKAFKELLHWGTPLDERIVENSRVASLGLELTQTGSSAENVAFVPLSGGVGVMLSLCIENVSQRTIKLNAIRLEMPWFDPDFSWVKKQPAGVLNHWGGYVVSGFGTYGLDPATVLNHRLTHNFAFYPGDAIEGFLLGEGRAMVPTQYCDRMKIPVQISCWEGLDNAYGTWLDVGVCRAKLPKAVKYPRRNRVPLFSAGDIVVASNGNEFVQTTDTN